MCLSISYDDITTLQTVELLTLSRHYTNPLSVRLSAKKRKTGPNHRQGNSGNVRTGQSMQYWDDPGNQGIAMSYDDAPNPVSMKVTAGEEEGEYDDAEEESRELTPTWRALLSGLVFCGCVVLSCS